MKIWVVFIVICLASVSFASDEPPPDCTRVLSSEFRPAELDASCPKDYSKTLIARASAVKPVEDEVWKTVRASSPEENNSQDIVIKTQWCDETNKCSEWRDEK